MDRLTLRAVRVNAGLTQLEASKGLGVSPRTLGKWEKGITFPDAKMIDRICEFYGVPYDGIKFLPDNPL